MPSQAMQDAMDALGDRQKASASKAPPTLAERRAAFTPGDRLHLVPDDVLVTEVTAGGVPAHWLARRPIPSSSPVPGPSLTCAIPGELAHHPQRSLPKGSTEQALPQRREKPMTGQPDSPAGLSFERDVRPMFREKDRDSMLKRFDLWSHIDVQAHQDAILERLRNGTMPCDGAWTPERVAIFQRWIASGSAP